MYLKQLNLIHFKNFSSQSFDYHPRLNCIIGKNGVGKTNILDAIHYLSIGKSYFNSVHSQNIQNGQDIFGISGHYERKSKLESLNVSYEKGKTRILKRNNKVSVSLLDHIGQFPLVIVTPYDNALIDEGSEVRRRFLDRSISQFDNNYFHNLSKYHKLLAQRNKLLKQFQLSKFLDTSLLSVLNKQMSEVATPIHERRKSFIAELQPHFNKLYADICNQAESVTLNYHSTLEDQNLMDILAQHKEKDLKVGYTVQGIHKDDFSVYMNGHIMKKQGSQGQKKTFIIALKLAEYLIIKEQSGLTPLLLLDDIFDKLDESRVGKIVTLIQSDTFGQSFITDTNYNKTEQSLANIGIEFKMIRVCNSQKA